MFKPIDKKFEHMERLEEYKLLDKAFKIKFLGRWKEELRWGQGQ